MKLPQATKEQLDQGERLCTVLIAAQAKESLKPAHYALLRLIRESVMTGWGDTRIIRNSDNPVVYSALIIFAEACYQAYAIYANRHYLSFVGGLDDYHSFQARHQNIVGLIEELGSEELELHSSQICKFKERDSRYLCVKKYLHRIGVRGRWCLRMLRNEPGGPTATITHGPSQELRLSIIPDTLEWVPLLNEILDKNDTNRMLEEAIRSIDEEVSTLETQIGQKRLREHDISKELARRRQPP